MVTRILVIDDEAALTRMVKLNLELTGQYEVRTENDSTKAIAAAREFQPELILLDVMMPVIDGDEIASQLKEDEQLSKIKFIFMTAIVSGADLEASGGSKIGGNEFLAKPASTEQIISAIERVLAAN